MAMMTNHTFGRFHLDATAAILFRGTEPTMLGQRGVALLGALLEHAGAPVSKDVLIETAWSGFAVEESNLPVQIAALRRVFADETGGDRWIETLPRHGYRYVGPVVTTEKDSLSTAAITQPEPILTPLNKPSIAVLPFDNISGNSDQEYFADGMAEEIITALSRFRLFLVIARTSSFIYKGRKVDVRQIGRELGVRYVLEGSVRKDGNQLRIMAQLVETTNGSHLWAEKYDGAVEHIFDLQDQITAGVVSAIAPSIRRAEIERAQRKRPESLDAYDLYLRALPLAWAFSPEETAKAILLLDEALRLDPSYAAAHGLAAFCHLRGFEWIDLSETEKAAAIHHARAVLSMDTDDATALAFSAYVIGLLEGDFDTACSALDKALALNPNSPQTYFLGAGVNSFVGRFDTVINYARRSLQLNPFDPLRYIMFTALSRACFLTERYEEAIEAALRATQVNPQFAPAYVWVVASHVRLGQMAQALEAKRQLLHVDPNFCFTRWASYIIAPPAHKEAIATALRDAGVPE
jgi:TolB-like protein